MDITPFIRESLLHPSKGILPNAPVERREAVVNSIITIGRELGRQLKLVKEDPDD